MSVDVTDDAVLWRRISKTMVKPSGVPQSNAFQDNVDGQVSVHLAELADLEAIRCEFPCHGIAQISAALPREHGLIVKHDPTDVDPSHTVIVPSPSKSIARKLAAAATWLVMPGEDQ